MREPYSSDKLNHIEKLIAEEGFDFWMPVTLWIPQTHLFFWLYFELQMTYDNWKFMRKTHTHTHTNNTEEEVIEEPIVFTEKLEIFHLLKVSS